MKALFFDIDGTLLSEKTRQIPESAKEALRKPDAEAILYLSIRAACTATCLRSALR